MNKIISEIKSCNYCKEVKHHSEFGYHARRVGNLNSICKECNKLKRRMYFKTQNGVITDMFSNQNKSSVERGIAKPNYTKDEFKEWVMSQQNFIHLFNKWTESNFSKWEKPSCDRVNDLLGYTFDNLQLVTWRENLNNNSKNIKCGKNTKDLVKVIRVDMLGNEILFNSVTLAGKSIGVIPQSISCVLDRKTPYRNYFWKRG